MRAARFPGRRPTLFGVVVIAVAALATVLLFQKSAIITALTPGETVTVQLARQYKIEPYASVVKMSGSRVGVVSAVEQPARGPARMTLKVYPGTRALLGTAPSAVIRPTTVLGGTYYVDLVSGGDRGNFTAGLIPVERTRLPVEFDRLLAAIPPPAQRGLQTTVERLDSTLKAGTTPALRQLLADAPGALRPIGTVADALRGVTVDTDLAKLVTDLNSTGRVLAATPGQLGTVVDSLADTSRVLGANAEPIDATIAALPDTVTAVRRGSDSLSATLDRLTDTAADARPTVRALDPLLRELDPTLVDLRGVLVDLRPLLRDAHPVVAELSPTLHEATSVLDDVNGPVLDRVNGPILDTVLTEWRGKGPKYPGGGATGSKFYEELGYMFTHLDNGVRYQDATAHQLGFQAGAGLTSLNGTGATAQQLQEFLTRMDGPPGRAEPRRVGPALPGGVTVPDPLTAPPPTLDPSTGAPR